jgi:beta-lactamase regulating signal transducer with metallopeptidase domain
MFADLLPHQAIAWLLTYLLHSTLLLGLAWLASKPLGRWSVAAEEAVWKLALVGALFTASLQLAAGWEPMAGRWTLPGVPAEVATVRDVAPEAPTSIRLETPSEPVLAAPDAATPMSLPSPVALALAAWALGSGLLLVAYVRSHWHLRNRLRHRPRVVGGTLLARLRALTAEAELDESVRLSCSSRVPVPVALGVRRSEICLPPRALAGLTDEQQEGMLAHELAHLVRRDSLWLVVTHVLSCLFFFQPLNWVARRRLREISELLSDEWAVRRTGRPLSLAGCLAEVAGWSTLGRELPVPGMADRPSHLGRRIRRLLDDSRSPESPARRIWLGAAMVVLLVAVVAAAPAISAARQASPAEPETPAEPAEPAEPAAAVSEATEPSAVEEPMEHDVAEERIVEKHVYVDDDEEDADWDLDYNFDFDFDFDHDLDFDFGFDADEIADLAADSVTAALDAMDVHLEGLSEMRALSEEERERLERDMERVNEEIERNLGPRMEQLSRELSEKLSRQMPTPEMRKLEEEMRKLGEQMRPSAEEMARLHAYVDEEMRKLHDVDGMSREERQKIAAEVRRRARELKPTEEQRKAMMELRQRHRELHRQFMEEHRAEIDKATREMREQIQQQMQAVREEVRRSTEQRRKLMEEERRERQRQREQMRKEREREREEGDAKPPKVSVWLDPQPVVSVQIQPVRVVVEHEHPVGGRF